MFSKFVNKKMNQSPEEALNEAKKSVNSGFTGGITKAFLGQEFVDKVNQGLDMGQSAMDGVNAQNMIAQTGLEATAEVLSVADTGATVNMNPVVEMKLKVTSSAGTTFETTAKTMVSRIAVPRSGDKIKIKYNPADPSQIAVL
jgi:hypothetical protein